MKKVFVEIGVCDFDTLEPLLKNGWEGYFVEPIKKYADKYFITTSIIYS